MAESFAVRLGVPEHEFRVVLGRTRIDYDPHKENENRTKHGYSLESAAHLLTACFGLFSGGRRIMISDGFLEHDEVRHMHLVEDDDGQLLLVVTTMRTDEVIRVISVRRASHDERLLFRANFGA